MERMKWQRMRAERKYIMRFTMDMIALTKGELTVVLSVIYV